MRSSGSPVDVRGPAYGVAERMGVLPRLRAAATQATRFSAVDERGRPHRVGADAAGRRHRDTPQRLAAVLADAGREAAEYLYSDTVTSLTDDGNGVDVTFERAAPRRFDLVVGADGLHSRVRELVFGTGFTHHMGLYVATVDLAGAVDDERTVLIHNTPGGPPPSIPRPAGASPPSSSGAPRCPASTTATRPGSARSSPRRTPAWGGECPSCSNECARQTTCTSTRSVGSGWIGGRVGASCCSATPRRACRCSARARAWRSRAAQRWPTPSPSTATIRRRHWGL